LIAGTLGDALDLSAAIAVVGALTALAGIWVAVDMPAGGVRSTRLISSAPR
jgi:hypothetical protein